MSDLLLLGTITAFAACAVVLRIGEQHARDLERRHADYRRRVAMGEPPQRAAAQALPSRQTNQTKN